MKKGIRKQSGKKEFFMGKKERSSPTYPVVIGLNVYWQDSWRAIQTLAEVTERTVSGLKVT